MQKTHHFPNVLERLRPFLAVLEEGSIRRAADRLRLSQPALTRQMQALEAELGVRVLERTSTGISPTSAGQRLAEKAKVLLKDFDSVIAEIQRLDRDGDGQLRIGYLASAVQEYLSPALAAVRLAHPRIKIKMLDQTPGEIIAALRLGTIDLALTLHGVDLLSRDFYVRKLATVGSIVALPVSHRLAEKAHVTLSELSAETFVRGSDEAVPGYTERINQICRKFGGFRPRTRNIDPASSLVESLALAANDDAISIQPEFISHLQAPNVVFVPIADSGASWDVSIVWHPGKMTNPLRTLLRELDRESL